MELALASASLPSGLIAIWKGSISIIPTGWVLCNGNNGTPDLRDKFVLGAGNSYSVSSTGGEKTHTLTISEMPSHNHTFTNSVLVHAKYEGGDNGRNYSLGESTSVSIGYTGGGSGHNNMPPYYALCYIMKT